jgi:hypothetical protein
MHIFKCFENQSDTYHDTRTHYLMEQDPLLLKDQVDGMDVVVADRMEVHPPSSFSSPIIICFPLRIVAAILTPFTLKGTSSYLASD